MQIFDIFWSLLTHKCAHIWCIPWTGVCTVYRLAFQDAPLCFFTFYHFLHKLIRPKISSFLTHFWSLFVTKSSDLGPLNLTNPWFRVFMVAPVIWPNSCDQDACSKRVTSFFSLKLWCARTKSVFNFNFFVFFWIT